MPHQAPTPHLQVAMIQDAARRRYALPATLHQANKLAVMYTDFFVRPGSLENFITKLTHCFSPATARSFAGRSHPQLLNANIHTWPMTLLKHKRMAKSFTSQALYYQQVARDHAKLITAQGYANANLLLGFIRNLHPELLKHARSQGLITVGDQIIAPAAIEIQQAQQQAQRYAHWQDAVVEDELAGFVAFEKQTWDQLDHILCMSEFVQQGLIAQGIAPEKIKLLPYPIDTTQFDMPDRTPRKFDHAPVTIGFVGAVNLRKGAPQFLETAKKFDSREARFVMVGQNHLKAQKLADYANHVQMVGKVKRHEIQHWLKQFDIFFFPSTCEGSAGAVIEAMAMGLPIVTTFNAGSPVRDGIEGRIVSCNDMDGYHNALAELIADQGKRLAMGQAARNRVMEFDMTWYQDALVNTLENFLHT